MGETFDKKQIVNSSELVRSFRKYEDEVSHHDIFIFRHNAPEAVLVSYNRYEQMKRELKELKDLFEHIHIYEIIEERKGSPEKNISIEELQNKYGL